MIKLSLERACISLILITPATVWAAGTIPEPGSWSLLGIGAVAGIVAYRFRRKK